ncbi:MAG: methionine biosynthesis protein MetW [Planctomycetota bacterium]|jgi:cyclopropane fatty-acyl-phospholipid synthase-like methyltransferase
MSFYSVVKTSYKTLLPNAVRAAIFRNMPKSLKLMRDSVIRKLEKSAKYDDIYDEQYYTDGLDPLYEKSCELIVESIMKVFCPKSVIDVGCGPGQLLLELKERGVTCRGLEYSSAALNICRQNGINVTQFDLEHDVLPRDFKADVVVSTEVAEHLQEQYADRFVDILCAIADNVIITAAEPATTYIADRTHVNEQPKDYWIEKFACNGFTHKEDIVSQFQADWKKHKVKPWFVQHLMVFRKNL